MTLIENTLLLSSYLNKLSHQYKLVEIETLLCSSEIHDTMEEEIAEAECGHYTQPLA